MEALFFPFKLESYEHTPISIVIFVMLVNVAVACTMTFLYTCAICLAIKVVL